MTQSPFTPGRYIGIDLGGTNMQIGLVDLDKAPGESAEHAEVTIRRKLKTKGEQGMAQVLDRLVGGVEDICTEIGIRACDLAGVCVGAPSPIDPYRGVVLHAVNLRWKNVALVSMLEARLGTRVFLDNDVNVALVGEAHFGAAKGASSVMGVWVGTGVGGALIFDGTLYHGKHFTAGEIGQTWLYPSGGPGLRTLEQVCSRTAIVNRLEAMILASHESVISDLVEGNLAKIKSRTIGEAYAQGDALTREIVDHAGEMLGTHIGSIQTLLSLQRVVLGGGLTEALGPSWVDLVATRAREVAFPDLAKNLEVYATMLKDDAGVLGAAMLAAQRLGDPRFAHPQASLQSQP